MGPRASPPGRRGDSPSRGRRRVRQRRAAVSEGERPQAQERGAVEDGGQARGEAGGDRRARRVGAQPRESRAREGGGGPESARGGGGGKGSRRRPEGVEGVRWNLSETGVSAIRARLSGGARREPQSRGGLKNDSRYTRGVFGNFRARRRRAVRRVADRAVGSRAGASRRGRPRRQRAGERRPHRPGVGPSAGHGAHLPPPRREGRAESQPSVRLRARACRVRVPPRGRGDAAPRGSS